MIEGFDKDALVIVNLVNPKEKFFGLLRSVSAAGVTMRAVNLDSFEDWMHQIARNEDPDIEMITMFVPLFRVERIFLDEAAGVTMRAVNLDSFEDWMHQIAREEEPNIEMITMFVPLFRVERIFLDEPAGDVKSYGQRFESVVGRTVAEHLGAESRRSV